MMFMQGFISHARIAATALVAVALSVPCPSQGSPVPKNGQKKPTRAIKLVIRWPGYTPQAVDESIGFKSCVQFGQLEAVQRVTSISTFDRADVYIEARTRTAQAAFSHAVIERLASMVKKLPDDAYLSQFLFCDNFTALPKVKIRPVAHLQLSIDRKALARHGLPIHALLARIKGQSIDLNERPPQEKTLKALRRLSIRAPSGKTLRLRDLAEIKVVNTPSHRVSHWPPAESQQR
jgi:Cu/Ag efflux pump CusA